MSVVTNILLTCSVCDEVEDGLPPTIIAINEWAKTWGALTDIKAHAGGHKYLEAGVYAGAFNYLDIQEFFAVVRQQAWEEPACVRLFVQEQEASHFSAYRLDDVGVIQIA